MDKFCTMTSASIKKGVSKKFKRWMEEKHQSDLRHTGYFNGGTLQFEVDTMSETHDEVIFFYFPKDRDSLEEYKSNKKKGRPVVRQKMEVAWPDQIGLGKDIEFGEQKTGYLRDCGEYVIS